MDVFFDNILENFRAINWEGPAMFGIIVLTTLAIFKQWKILLITLLTIVLGWGAEDLIIMNIANNLKVINMSLLIYCSGSVIVIILLLISFFKLAL